ncbi:MAG: hypothetical protein ACLPX9_07675 [Rhodomicrobium sp.]
MIAKKEDEKKLSEVREILQSLQKIGIDRPPEAGAANKPGHNVTSLESVANRRGGAQASGRAAGLVPVDNGAPAKEASAEGRTHQRRLGALALATMAGGTVLLLAADMALKYLPAAAPAGKPAITSVPVLIPAPASLPPLPAEAPRATAKEAAQTPAPAVPHAPPAPQAPPPAPPSPAIANAKQLMDAGKIVAARDLLMRQSLSTSQDGAWLLARSYDPNYLAAVKAPDAAGDKEKAAEWYRRWRDIGARNGAAMDDVRFRRLIETMN